MSVRIIELVTKGGRVGINTTTVPQRRSFNSFRRIKTRMYDGAAHSLTLCHNLSTKKNAILNGISERPALLQVFVITKSSTERFMMITRSTVTGKLTGAGINNHLIQY